MLLWILGYPIVLAVLASEVTSHTGYGKGFGARHEMKKGLLLDRVNIHGDHLVINKGIKGAVPVLPYPAYPPPAVDNVAMVTAQEAVDLSPFYFFIQHCLFHIDELYLLNVVVSMWISKEIFQKGHSLNKR